MTKKRITEEIRYREGQFESLQDRMATISFSSEAHIERWFGIEVLGHNIDNVRLGRLNSGAAVLLNHDADQHVGVVEKSWLGPDKKGRAVIRFSKSPKGEEVHQDVMDGIRRNVSVGYLIHDYRVEKADDGDKEIYFANDWEPLEISIVSVPADTSVGVGRNLSMEKTIMTPENTEKTVPQIDVEQIRKDTRQAELSRVRDIHALGEQFQMREFADKHAQEGTALDDFRGFLLEEIKRSQRASPVSLAKQTVNPEIGMTEKEIRQYSLCRAIMAQATNDWRYAGLEREANFATAKKLGRDPKGFFIPPDVQNRRDFTLGTSGSPGGGYASMDPQLLVANFIDLLQNKMIVRQLGAEILGELTGDVLIPKQTGGATAYWVAESGAPTESQQTIGQITLRPKTVGAFSDISRKLLIQSSLYVESFVRRDISRTIALAIDLAALAGTGQNNQPTGILATAGIGSTTWSGTPTFANVVNMATIVATANADRGSMSYITTPAVSGVLRTTPKVTAQATYLWSESNLLNGYPAYETNQMTTGYVLFGNWSDLIIAEWTGTDILVDPYTGGTSGTIRVIAHQDVDIGVRYPQSFCEMHAGT
jgi:HK97 family phage major capsid protein/HK97 family phage prohead protease